jgi:hypothetical protein
VAVLARGAANLGREVEGLGVELMPSAQLPGPFAEPQCAAAYAGHVAVRCLPDRRVRVGCLILTSDKRRLAFHGVGPHVRKHTGFEPNRKEIAPPWLG